MKTEIPDYKTLIEQMYCEVKTNTPYADENFIFDNSNSINKKDRKNEQVFGLFRLSIDKVVYILYIN